MGQRRAESLGLSLCDMDKESSLRFITQLVRYYAKRAPGIPLVIVWDKHPGHTSQLVKDFVNDTRMSPWRIPPRNRRI